MPRHANDLDLWEEIEGLWSAVDERLCDRITDCYRKLANISDTEDMGAVRHIQGQIAALESIRQLPSQATKTIRSNLKGKS